MNETHYKKTKTEEWTMKTISFRKSKHKLYWAKRNEKKRKIIWSKTKTMDLQTTFKSLPFAEISHVSRTVVENKPHQHNNKYIFQIVKAHKIKINNNLIEPLHLLIKYPNLHLTCDKSNQMKKEWRKTGVCANTHKEGFRKGYWKDIAPTNRACRARK